MSRRESWDWETEQTYISRGVRPRVDLVTHLHRCPDGTRVVVTAQYIATTDTTLYRWRVGGKRGEPSNRRGDWREVAPEWDLVDAEHTVAA